MTIINAFMNRFRAKQAFVEEPPISPVVAPRQLRMDPLGKVEVSRWITLDFEAQLDEDGRYFPIELGFSQPWGFTNSLLIRPEKSWVARPSEIRRPDLLKKAMETGKPASEVAEHLLGIIADRRVFSDALWLDQALLHRLITDAKPGRAVPQMEEFFVMLDALKRRYGWSVEKVNASIGKIDAARSESHRAAEDARVRSELLARLMAGVPA